MAFDNLTSHTRFSSASRKTAGTGGLQIGQFGQLCRRQLGRMLRWVAVVRDVAVQRRDLMGLTDEQLRDVGLTQADIRQERTRSRLEVPDTQRQRMNKCRC